MFSWLKIYCITVTELTAICPHISTRCCKHLGARNGYGLSNNICMPERSLRKLLWPQQKGSFRCRVEWRQINLDLQVRTCRNIIWWFQIFLSLAGFILFIYLLFFFAKGPVWKVKILFGLWAGWCWRCTVHVTFLCDISNWQVAKLEFLLSYGKECHSNCLTEQAVSSNRASDLYPRGAQFTPRSRHRLSWLRFFVVILSPPDNYRVGKTNLGMIVSFPILPNSLSSSCSTLHNLSYWHVR
jgi:hypothetical protein